MNRQRASVQPFTLHRTQKPRGDAVPMHAHATAQLTVTVSGMIQVHTEAGRWLVPPQLAVWAGAGVAHRVDVLADAEVWMIKLNAAFVQRWAPRSLDRAFALRVTPLMRSLITAAFTTGAAGSKLDLIVRLILHELTEVPDAPTFLPFPASDVGLRVAEAAFADYRNALNVEELASRAATSVRTLSRLFPAETGLTFKTWRQRARIVWAIDRLSTGTPVSQVAGQAGFGSTAAFSHAFRQVTKMTPTAFLERHTEASR